jgi:hypothetical protein
VRGSYRVDDVRESRPVWSLSLVRGSYRVDDVRESRPEDQTQE